MLVVLTSMCLNGVCSIYLLTHKKWVMTFQYWPTWSASWTKLGNIEFGSNDTLKFASGSRYAKLVTQVTRLIGSLFVAVVILKCGGPPHFDNDLHHSLKHLSTSNVTNTALNGIQFQVVIINDSHYMYALLCQVMFDQRILKLDRFHEIKQYRTGISPLIIAQTWQRCWRSKLWRFSKALRTERTDSDFSDNLVQNLLGTPLVTYNTACGGSRPEQMHSHPQLLEDRPRPS